MEKKACSLDPKFYLYSAAVMKQSNMSSVVFNFYYVHHIHAHIVLYIEKCIETLTTINKNIALLENDQRYSFFQAPSKT